MFTTKLTVPVLISALFLASTLCLGQAGTIRVDVSNLKSNQGVCRFCLFAQGKADGFPESDKKALKCTVASITTNKSTFVFDNIPAGVYAISTYHDANSNAKLDANFMGIPKEDYGFSNNARGGLTSPPKFEAAQFTHQQAETVVAIQMTK